ncbi:MAG: isopenicillin N synthase family oxygenase [Alphaproteobacteria bacterium]|nr:isopenicillin N synthase family oxygenase [Alphaproteobacteria bacterium]
MATLTDRFRPIDFRKQSADPAGFAARLGESFRETGFAVIDHHSMDIAKLDAGLAVAKAFFALPEPTRLKYVVPDGAGQRGFTPFRTEIAKGAAAHDLKEFWHVGRNLPAGHRLSGFMPENLSVSEIPGWDATTTGMFDELDRFGRVLLSSIARHLGLDNDFFDDPVRDGNSILRLLHYPPQTEPPPEGSVRAGAHEDINVITLLLGAEEGGLEVLHRNGDWLAVNPPAGSLVVNIGDMLQRLTNHVLPSTSHRVVNPRPERARYSRYSTPFFLHFRPDYEIRTSPQCISDANPNRYPEPILAQDFLMQRLKEIGLRM